MQKIILPNGLTVIYERQQGNAAIIQLMVKVGSNHESPKERGISHLLEHLLFEGTKKRPDNQIISNEIEKLGGDFNAYTTNERTSYYVKVLKKHTPKAMDILQDIFQNSLFKPEHIAKEKTIVLKETDLVNDEPSYYQWLLFQKTMFKSHPAGYPTYGDKKVVKNLSREEILTYFNKWYVPKNMVLCIVGDIPNWKSLAQKYFTFSPGKSIQQPKWKEPVKRKAVLKTEKRKTVNTYLIQGYLSVPQNHSDAYVLEVIHGILGRGQSGRMFTEIRGKRALAYDVGTQHVAERTFGYFAVYATIAKNNLSLVRKLMNKELTKLQEVTLQDVKESQTFLEGNYLLELEDGQKRADQLLFWEQIKEANLLNNYVKKVKKVTPADVKRIAKKYFKNPTTIVVAGK